MKQQISLKDYIKSADSLDKDGVVIVIDPKQISPGTEETLRKLNRLGLLNDKVLMSLVAQAPIDPAGMLSFCSSLGGWEFVTDNFSARKTLSKNTFSKEAMSYMMIDVLSNSIFFLIRSTEGLKTYAEYSVNDINERIKDSDNKEEALQRFIENEITKTVKAADSNSMLEAVTEGLKDLDAGKGIPHENLFDKLDKRLSDDPSSK
jgi:hypothetical protein